jgi:hypothetical protein
MGKGHSFVGASEQHSRMLTGGSSVDVGEMQKKLSLWAEQDKSKRFYDLFDLLHQDELKPRELADLLETSEDFLFQEAHKGNLDAVRLGDDILHFKRADVLDWLTRREAGTLN